MINDVYPITGVEDLLTFTNMSGKDTNIYLHANTTYIIKNITPLGYSTASGPLSIKGYENEYYISCPAINGTVEFTPLHDGYLHMYNGNANATGLKLRVIGKIDDIEKQLNDLSTVKDDIFLIQSDIDRKGSNYIHGSFNNTGNIYYPSNGVSCITDFISTFPGLIVSSYGVPGVIHSCVFYDKNKNKISNPYQYQPSFSGIVTPENAYYVRVQITESQFNNIEIRVNPYTLKASSSSQIRTCLDRNYISQRIIVANGTYNLYDTFTENEINNAVYNNTEWCGIDIKNNTVLEGESREGTIITCEIPESFSISNRDAISTFNIKGNCTLKNLTIKSKNIRYPIHDDFKQSVNTIHKLINCNFIAGPNATGSNGYKTNGYGLGSRSGETIIFNNCYIEPYMIYHNNTGFDVGSSVIMNNCEVSEKINVWDANCPVQCKFELNNVKCGCLTHTYDTSHNNQTIEIIGTGSSPDFIYAQSNTIYNLGNCRKVQVHWGGNQGMLVCSHYGDNNIKFGTVRTTDKSNTAIGILLNDTAEDDFGIIQCSGYISANKLGNTDITNWQTGTMLTVGNNCYLTPTLDKSECIAYVAIIIDNVMYIKLCLK